MPTETQARSPLKAVFFTFLLGVLFSVGAYFAGTFQANARLSSAQNGALQLRAENENKMLQLDELFRQNAARADFYASINALHRASVALDRRNFGIANDQIEKAQTFIARARPLMLEEDALAKLEEETKTLRVAVAPDLEEQRAKLMSLIERYEAIAARREAEPATTQTSAPSPAPTATAKP